MKGEGKLGGVYGGFNGGSFGGGDIGGGDDGGN